MLASQFSSSPYATAQSDAPSDIQLYQNPDYGISLSYPSDWEREQDFRLPEGGIVGFLSPMEGEEDQYRENVEVVYNNLRSGTTLDDYTKTLLQRYSDNLGNFTVIDSSPFSLTNSSIPAHKLIFNFSDGDYHYVVLNIWAVIGDKALIVIYYAEPSKYSVYLPTINKVIDSLQVDPVIFGKPEPGGQYVIPSLGFQAEVPHDWISIDSGSSSNSTLLKAAPLAYAESNSTDRVIMFITLEETGQNHTSIDVARRFLNNSDKDYECGTALTLASIVNVNADVKALQSELNCSDGMIMKKIKSYMVASQGVIIFVGYASSSEAAYEKNLSDFDNSIQRLQLASPADLSNPDELARLFGFAEHQKVLEVNGTSQTINYGSASNVTVTDLALDENAKKLSLTIITSPTGDDGGNKQEGAPAAGDLMFIRVSDILRGPYIATANGNVIVEGGAGEDANGAGLGLLILTDMTNDTKSYMILSRHEDREDRYNVSIVGTSVVPEFGSGISSLNLAALIGMLISLASVWFLGRNGIFTSNHSSV